MILCATCRKNFMLKIVVAFAFLICQNVKKVKVQKYRVKNIPYKVIKQYRNLHMARQMTAEQ